MSKIFYIFFIIVTLYSQSDFWDYNYSYTLKKDQVAKVVIKKDYIIKKKEDGILRFRWTLYSANRLVLLVNYEGYPTQYILEKRYKRDTIKIVLLGDYPTISKQAFAIIRFRDFKDKKATFDVMIKDPQHRMEVRFK